MRYLFVALLLAGLSACGEAPKQKSETAAAPKPPTALDLRRAERVDAMAASYVEGISFKDHYNALDPRLKRSGVTRGSMFDAADDYWGLPRTSGYEEVAGNCSGCHSLQIVMQQHVTTERWGYLLKWMVEKQGMMAMEPEDEVLVRAYLNTHFSSGSE